MVGKDLMKDTGTASTNTDNKNGLSYGHGDLPENVAAKRSVNLFTLERIAYGLGITG